MKEIIPSELTENSFTMLSKDWILITAEKDGIVNTMTASWGGLGVLWNKNVAYIFIRPQRYTKEFVDVSERLSICVLPNTYRKELAYLGKVSGREENKIEKANLTVKHYEEVPYFEESRLTFICKKLYVQRLTEDCFLDQNIIEKWYPEKDYHYMYVVEINNILEK